MKKILISGMVGTKKYTTVFLSLTIAHLSGGRMHHWLRLLLHHLRL